MNNWSIFEKECLKYLKETYCVNGVSFSAKGNCDSTISDILVTKNRKPLFYIEAKMANAQSGQFVLLIEDDHFIYSSKNKQPLNEHSEIILNYVNEHFKDYSTVGTNSMNIELKTEIFSKWVKNHYRKKGVEFLITEGKHGKFVFHLNNYEYFFEFNAVLRRKKSGSSNLPKSKFEIVKTTLNRMFGLNELKYCDKKAYCNLKKNPEHGTIFSIPNGDRFILKNDGANYIVTQLGKTNNPSLIFNVKLLKHSSNDGQLLLKHLNC